MNSCCPSGDSTACQIPAVSLHGFTASVERGWPIMASMWVKQLTIIEATSPHMCRNLRHHSSIHQTHVFFLVQSQWKASQPGSVKSPAALQLCPFGLWGTSAPLNIFPKQGVALSSGWSFGQTCLCKKLCEGTALSPSHYGHSSRRCKNAMARNTAGYCHHIDGKSTQLYNFFFLEKPAASKLVFGLERKQKLKLLIV